MREIKLITEARFGKHGESLVAVALPHTWNNLDGQDGGNDYWRGIGTYEIEDTGGDERIVNGNCIDIYIPDYDAAIEFGRKDVVVYLIEAKG